MPDIIEPKLSDVIKCVGKLMTAGTWPKDRKSQVRAVWTHFKRRGANMAEIARLMDTLMSKYPIR